MKIYNILTEETIKVYYLDNVEETKKNFNDYSKNFYYSPEFERIFVYGSVIASVYEIIKTEKEELMLKKIGETNKSFKNLFIFDGKLTLTGDLGIDFYDLKNLNFLKTMYNNTTKYHIPQDTIGGYNNFNLTIHKKTPNDELIFSTQGWWNKNGDFTEIRNEKQNFFRENEYIASISKNIQYLMTHEIKGNRSQIRIYLMSEIKENPISFMKKDPIPELFGFETTVVTKCQFSNDGRFIILLVAAEKRGLSHIPPVELKIYSLEERKLVLNLKHLPFKHTEINSFANQLFLREEDHYLDQKQGILVIRLPIDKFEISMKGTNMNFYFE